MKKNIRHPLILLLFVSFALLLFSCSLPDGLSEEESGTLSDPPEGYVAFAQEAAQTPTELKVEDAALYASYESRFAPLRSSVHFDTLSPAEQRIYRLFEYALDEGYPCLYMDERLLEEAAHSPGDILYFLSLDSPMVEQNLSFTRSTVRFDLSENGKRVEVTAALFEVEAFHPDRLAKKEEALEKAREIVSELEGEEGSRERARAIYLYLTEQVAYQDYDGTREANYLYDALVQKKTHCDGFSNAYSLLCHLSELRCFEKSDDGSADENGHTWNSVFFDGAWYNVDCSLSPDVAAEQRETGILVRFGFSDERQTHTPSFSELTPDCTQDLLTLDCDFERETDPELSRRVAEAFRSTERDFVLLRLREGEMGKQTLQRLANEMQTSFSALAYGWGSDTYYILIKK